MIRHFALPLAVSLLSSCSSGTSSPVTPPGSGGNATSGYVLFTGTQAPGGDVRPFLAELDTGAFRDLTSLMGGQAVSNGGSRKPQVSSDGEFIALTGRSQTSASRRIISVSEGTVSARAIPGQTAVQDPVYAWSPDGTLLLSLIPGSGPGDGTLELTSPASGVNSQPSLTRPNPSTPLLWSKDGSHFALRSFTESPLRVSVDIFDRGGSLLASVVPLGLDHHNGDMAFGTDRLAFSPETFDSAGQAISSQLYSFDTFTATSRSLASGTPFVREPLWSADGEWVSWSVEEVVGGTAIQRLFMLDVVAGAAPVQLSNGTGQTIASAPVWNPHDVRLAWISRRDPASGVNPTLCVTDSAGLSRTFSSPSISQFGDTLWSPDGRYLAFTGAPGNVVHVWDLAGSSDPVRPLVNGFPSSGFGLQWTPDSRHLAWSSASSNGADLSLWAPGAILDATVIGDRIVPTQLDTGEHIFPRPDSSEIVWIRSEGGSRAVMATEVAPPHGTRVISSGGGTTGWARIETVTVR